MTQLHRPLAVLSKKHLTVKAQDIRRNPVAEGATALGDSSPGHKEVIRAEAPAPSRSHDCHVSAQFLSGHVQNTGGKFSKGGFSGKEIQTVN